MKIVHASSNITLHDGDLGVAQLPNESSTIGKLTQHGGNAEFGTVTMGEIERNDGEFIGQDVTLSGPLVIR